MKTFPLVRRKLSNERIMAYLFAVLLLYRLPSWINDPSLFLRFALVLAAALAADTILNCIRFKKPMCAVSAAVTSGIISVLCPSAPTGILVITTISALALWKHAFGGTGKNSLNPAMCALALIALLNPGWMTIEVAGAFGSAGSFIVNRNPLLAVPLILALVLSIPFAAFRPASSLGFMAGSIGAFALGLALSPSGTAALFWSAFVSLIGSSLFWACLVMTDPVTVTRRRLLGSVCGLVGGAVFVAVSIDVPFLPFRLPAILLPLFVLAVNCVSFIADRVLPFNESPVVRGKRIRSPVRLRADAAPLRVNVEPFGETPGNDRNLSVVDFSVDDFTSDEIIARIAEAGVIGLGGAGFPSHEKIMAVAKCGLSDTVLIVNGVECDPGLVHDKWLLASRGEDIARGIELVMKAAGTRRAVLAVKRHTLCSLPSSSAARVVRVPDRYPVGAERVLIRTVTGVSVPADRIPAREGFLVLNAQTVLAIYEAVLFGRKADRKFLTVADFARGEAKVAEVRLGTPIKDVFSLAFPGNAPAFAGGGLMRSFRIADGDVVDRKTNFIARSASPFYKESPFCSRCGLCSRVCPASLNVMRISDLVDAGNAEGARALGAERCLECGSCAYHCLAGKNLSWRVGLAKNKKN